MDYTIVTEPVDEGFTRLIVTFANGLVAETTVKGGAADALWYAKQAFVPDLRRIYPELREDGEA